MDIFAVFTMCGGLAFFLYGMNVLSAGLEKMAGSKMKTVLRHITSSRMRGLLVGAGVTAVIQSSSAVTVMLVGLVNSGILELSQAISVTMGSNIGTTITAWILSLTGIQSETVWVQLLQPRHFALVIAFVGACILLLAKKQSRRDAGTVCVGFAVLMYGMTMMSDAVAPLAEVPAFRSILTAFSNPLLGVLAGTVFTAIIQSSSASVGVLQALSMTGAVTLGTAVPLVMGQNIGACISALLASVGANKNAKRVAVTHLLFNCIGTAVFLVIWSVASGDALAARPVTPVQIAIVHSVFNLAATAMLLPAAGLLEKLSYRFVSGETDVPLIALDERLMTVPSFAVSKARHTTGDMAVMAQGMVVRATALLTRFDRKEAEEIGRLEATLDRYEDQLGTYLVGVSRCVMSDADFRTTAMLLHTISDFERIGDHAYNLTGTATEMADKHIAFSEEARREVGVLTDALTEILNITVEAFQDNDPKKAMHIEPLEQVIDSLIETIRTRHIIRLQNGCCTIELGFVLTDLLTDYERISDHCSNIGIAIIETAHDAFDTHAHLESIKAHPDEAFRQDFTAFSTRFSLDRPAEAE